MIETSSEAVTRRRVLPTVPPRAAVLAVVLVQLVALYLVHRTSGYQSDDLLFQIIGQNSDWSWDWITSAYYQHWGPGVKITYSTIQTLGIGYRGALVVFLILHGISTLALYGILTLLSGVAWRNLVFAALFAFSSLFAADFAWFSAALQGVVGTAATLSAIYGVLRYRRDDSWRWLALAVGVMTLGFAFYVRPILLLVYLPLMTVFLFPRGGWSLRSAWEALWSMRPVWFALSVPAALYLACYFAFGTLSSGDSQPFTATEFQQFVRIAWLRTIGPALLGQEPGLTDVSLIGNVAIVLAQILIALAVIVSIARRRSAWRGWAFFAVALAGNLVLVAMPRLGLFSPTIGLDTRYFIDFAWLVPIVLTAVFVVPDGADPRSAGDPKAAQLRAPRTAPPAWLIVATSVFLVAYSVSALATARRDMLRLWGDEGRVYLGALKSGLERLPANAVVADRTTPEPILGGWTMPYNRMASLVPLYDDAVPVVGAVSGPLFMVDPTGAVRPAAVKSLATESLARRWRSGAVTVEAGTATREGRGICVVATTQIAHVRVLTPAGTPGAQVYLRVRSSSGAPFSSGVQIANGGTFTIVAGTTLSVPRDGVDALAFVGDGVPEVAQFDLPANSRSCFSQIDVVLLEPKA